MAAELLGAKILAPYFGTSLYVWAAALGLTLGGLMSGYFLGGRLSVRFSDRPAVLYWVLIFGGVTFFLMPITAGWIMELCLNLPIQLGTTLSLLVFMFPPLLFMGMVSPLIINLLTKKSTEAGNRAGTVYAISTFGGIIATFLMGFWIIPVYGINTPAMVWGILLAFFPTVSLLNRKVKGAAAGVILLFLMVLARVTYSEESNQSDWKLIYQEEGILGQIKIIDFQPLNLTDGPTYRGLIVNNTLQTIINLDEPSQDYQGQNQLITKLAKQLSPDGKVLLLGMGGGALANQLHSQGYRVDAVEIDARLDVLSREYFGLPDDVRVFIDDARHFVKTSEDAYKLIVFDIFQGESAPEHILTLESLREAMEKLDDHGHLIINFYGYWKGERGALGRALYATLQKAGLHTRIFASTEEEEERKLIFMAGKSASQLNNVKAPLELGHAGDDAVASVILTDDQPQLFLYGRAAAQWRRLYNQFYIMEFSKLGN